MSLNNEKIHDLEVFAAKIRLETIRIIASLGSGHLGGSMSIVDALAVLYGEVMNIDPKDPRKADRDWCVLSKGHAGPAMYATLGLKGYYPIEDAYTLNYYGSSFPSHTDRNKTIGVDLTTGSLGQGISEAVGAAYGNRLQNIDSRVFVFVGDGEAQEGQVWEAAEFAVHYKLNNLICLIDNNGRQLDGAVEDVMSHGKGLFAKFDAFGFNTINVEDGNDIRQIHEALMKTFQEKEKPSALILNTVKGKGTFAEKTGEHSSKHPKEVWDQAIKEAEDDLAKLMGGDA
ncbi:MAG: transketolase [Erysipelotrichaceae bacterium]|nr:transketolase [Erysipelotrichaceae bacterium]